MYKIFTGKSYKYKIGFIGGGIDSLIGATSLQINCTSYKIRAC